MQSIVQVVQNGYTTFAKEGKTTQENIRLNHRYHIINTEFVSKNLSHQASVRADQDILQLCFGQHPSLNF